uniref:Uncharacterized protein n=1 Tax=Tanacetum cinerariifolium TaxID=118510 RepID=A0A6L2MZH8_TANCI|nr:hypothetical protein [Tanacetum cinerariifolium]
MVGNDMYKVCGMNDTQQTHKNECRSPVSGPYIDEDQKSPLSAPSSLPRFWISLMRVMQRVATFFWPGSNFNRPKQLSVSDFYASITSEDCSYQERQPHTII